MLVTCKFCPQGMKCHYNVDGYCTAGYVNIDENCHCDYVFNSRGLDTFPFVVKIDDECKDLSQVPLEQEMDIIEEEQPAGATAPRRVQRKRRGNHVLRKSRTMARLNSKKRK